MTVNPGLAEIRPTRQQPAAIMAGWVRDAANDAQGTVTR